MTAATTAATTLPRTPVRTTGATAVPSHGTWLVGAAVLLALGAADAVFVTASLEVQRTGRWGPRGC